MDINVDQQEVAKFKPLHDIITEGAKT